MNERAEQMAWCRTCGIVRKTALPAWCRHNDPERHMPAARMEPLPSYHPLAREAGRS